MKYNKSLIILGALLVGSVQIFGFTKSVSAGDPANISCKAYAATPNGAYAVCGVPKTRVNEPGEPHSVAVHISCYSRPNATYNYSYDPRYQSGLSTPKVYCPTGLARTGFSVTWN